MKLLTFCFQFIFGLIVAVVGYLAYVANKYGEFNEVIPKGLETCHKMEGNFDSVEDLVSIEDGTLLGSQDDRRWFKMAFYSTIPYSQLIKNSNNGAIVVIPSNNNIKPYHAKMINFPINTDFHPHGIYSVTLDSKEWLFVINHRSNNDFIEIFQIIKNKNEETLL